MKITFLLFLCFSLNAFASEGVFQIGDSQSQGIFGKTWFAKVKKDTTHKFNIVARGSGTVANWLDYSKLAGNFRKYKDDGTVVTITPLKLAKLKALFTEADPETIIIQLGGNMVQGSDDSVRKNVSQMLSLVKEHASQCIWIGPPNGHKRPQPRFGVFYKVLKESVEKEGCTFIDSRPHTTYPAGRGDGIHYDSLGADGKVLVKTWVNGIAEIIFPLL